MVAPSQSRPPLGLHIQPACLQHKYIRHANSNHIFERPERLRAVLLGFAGALARLEAADAAEAPKPEPESDDLSSMLSSLSLGSTSAFLPPSHVAIVPPPTPPATPGQILKHHPAVQITHSPPIEAPFPFLPKARGAALPSSEYMKELYTWASEAVETIRTTGCEFPQDKGLNAGDLYLGPGSVLAIEGCVQTVCQAVDGVCTIDAAAAIQEPRTPVQNVSAVPPRPSTPQADPTPAPPAYNKAFCAIRPPGHHCGEDEPSGFCYVNNVVVGAMHAYLQHDVDRAIIIDFDLHHGNGTQALVMPLNAASYAEDLAMAAGKPPSDLRGLKGQRRGWKGFYGSVHDIYSYPCEDGDLDLIKDASLSLAAHGQYIENIHLQPYDSEEDFYKRIYPMYTALLDKARLFLRDTEADPERTVVFISAGFDACEHEHQGMQRHNRRVPVSFYSRYTRDLAAFADAHTGGKVVSVLEGGYGDRALTSAAMGHAIGLLGREGAPSWWSVEELDNLERATKKKKRGGKLAALPPDLTSTPHLARAHALLSHFEGSAPVTPAPSVNATPQATANGRMTLRERRPRTYAEDTDIWSSSPRDTGRRRRGAATTANTPVATPRRNADGKTEDAYPSPVSSPTAVPPEPKIEAPAQPKLEAAPVQPKLEVPSEPVDYASPISEVSDASENPKIILKIPRVTPPREEDVSSVANGAARAPVSAAPPVAARQDPPKVAPQAVRPSAPAAPVPAPSALPKTVTTAPVVAPAAAPKLEAPAKASNPATPTTVAV
ncbi:histone deacetylase [Vanrija albida]|uniref:Histone deacetylase n=1 Tax=Vanrija albida TaxID=181172 RepID=A0ABR3Q5P4_9TREE